VSDDAYFARAEMETQFWAILDDKEFAAVPSDMWAALDIIIRGWRASSELRAKLLESEATISRVREALDFLPERYDLQIRADIAQDLSDGMSLRTIARRYGVGVGIVRGVARRLADGRIELPERYKGKTDEYR